MTPFAVQLLMSGGVPDCFFLSSPVIIASVYPLGRDGSVNCVVS
ncbi:MAG TPA: hypothetical protein VHT91_48865 [Kofleriaceae bacterium]|nr:hypothetical protein [Kofleriaceae bacterium]